MGDAAVTIHANPGLREQTRVDVITAFADRGQLDRQIDLPVGTHPPERVGVAGKECATREQPELLGGHARDRAQEAAIGVHFDDHAITGHDEDGPGRGSAGGRLRARPAAEANEGNHGQTAEAHAGILPEPRAGGHAADSRRERDPVSGQDGMTGRISNLMVCSRGQRACEKLEYHHWGDVP